MVEWLRSELGGLLVAVFGYLLRELSESQVTPLRIFDRNGTRFLIRVILATMAGAVTLAMLPEGLPNYARVGILAFVGAATPEIVRLLLVRGMAQLDKQTKDPTDAK